MFSQLYYYNLLLIWISYSTFWRIYVSSVCDHVGNKLPTALPRMWLDPIFWGLIYRVTNTEKYCVQWILDVINVIHYWCSIPRINISMEFNFTSVHFKRRDLRDNHHLIRIRHIYGVACAQEQSFTTSRRCKMAIAPGVHTPLFTCPWIR